MSDPLPYFQQDEALSEFVQLAAERAKLEVRIQKEFDSKSGAVEKKFKELSNRIETTFGKKRNQLEKEFRKNSEAILSQYEKKSSEAETNFGNARQRILEEYETEEEKAQAKRKETRWEATTVYDATKYGPKERLENLKKRITQHIEQLQEIESQARDLLVSYSQPDVLGEPILIEIPDVEEEQAEEEPEEADEELKEADKKDQKKKSKTEKRKEAAEAKAKKKEEMKKKIKKGKDTEDKDQATGPEDPDAKNEMDDKEIAELLSGDRKSSKKLLSKAGTSRKNNESK